MRAALRGETTTAAAAAADAPRPNAAALPQQALHGLGGVGKTQLAVEYCYRHAADYDLVWWLRAEEPAALAAAYALLAHKLNLPEKDVPDQRAVVDAVRDWLRRHERWLLVFDNANEPRDLLDYLPHSAAGHVLITSRNPNWRRIASPLRVRVMEHADAIDFLLKRTGEHDRAAAGQLAAELGDLPLALEQAGAYVEATGETLASYRQLFAARQRELLQRHQPLDYPATVLTTWDLSRQQAAQQSPHAEPLLNLCAFLAPDDIPKSLFSPLRPRKGIESQVLGAVRKFLRTLFSPLHAGKWAEGQVEPSPLHALADPLAPADGIAALRRYSLVEASEQALALHRMVQAVTRERLDDDARRQWAGAAVEVVNAAFPYDSDDVRTWTECARLLAHALASTAHAEALGVQSKATARLLNQTALYLKGRAQFAEARNLFERALRIWEASLGEAHPQVASALNNLGSVLKAQGDLAGARQLYERALRLDEASLGPDHPTVATRLNNLGSVLQDLGDLAGARQLCERALRIREAALGSDHPDVAQSLNNLGTLLQAQGDLAGARPYFERALRILRQSLGDDHPTTRTVQRNLARLLAEIAQAP